MELGNTNKAATKGAGTMILTKRIIERAESLAWSYGRKGIKYNSASQLMNDVAAELFDADLTIRQESRLTNAVKAKYNEAIWANAHDAARN